MVEMESLSCLMQENNNSMKKMIRWSKEENKMFERAIAMFDEEIPDRWQRIAAMIPGKTVSDVMKQYSELEADVSDIEAGLVPIPGYFSSSSSFTVEMMANCRVFGALSSTKRPIINRSDHERKKGIPWTEEEHRRFLMGLEKHGKGDWRNISRNYVISKTPTQVASHAQKYFIRQNSLGTGGGCGGGGGSSDGGKDKRRPSIHDITTFHITSSNSASVYKKNGNKSQLASNEQTVSSSNAFLNWTRARGDTFVQYPPYGFASNMA